MKWDVSGKNCAALGWLGLQVSCLPSVPVGIAHAVLQAAQSCAALEGELLPVPWFVSARRGSCYG